MALLDALFNQTAATPSDSQNAGLLSMLLGASGGLLSSSGPSRLPVSTGQVLGAGLTGGFQGLKNFNANRLAGAEANLYSQESQKNQLTNAITMARFKDVASRHPEWFGGSVPGASTMPSGQPTGGGLIGGLSDPGGYKSFATAAGLATPNTQAVSPAPATASTLPSVPGNGLGVNFNNLRDAQDYLFLHPEMKDIVGKQILGATDQPAYKADVAGAQAKAEAPYKAIEALLERAGYVHNIGPNEKAVTGFQAIPGLQGLFDNLTSGIAPKANPTPTPPAKSQMPGQIQAQANPPPGIDPGLWSSIPKVTLPNSPDRGPGGVMQGISSAQLQMQQKSNDAKAQIDAAGSGASSQLGSLKALEAGLNSGQFNTNALAPARATLSTYVNAITGDRGLAKSLTGIDPAQAEVFNKDATRMGLQFARSTEGAREAVQAIKIALGANPSLQNTMEANKMIVQMMERAAQYQIDTSRASDAFYLKNGHNVTFEGWWNKEHPSSQYITGKTLPYSVPMTQQGTVDTNMLLPGFTYRSPTGKVGVWNGKGFEVAQ